jgi:hypothetical protein
MAVNIRWTASSLAFPDQEETVFAEVGLSFTGRSSTRSIEVKA